MGNQSAKSRKADDVDEVGSDRISRLPDSILHHILCFLSQKKAVQTSVLSKSWRHLGPTRPVIDLRGACYRYHSCVNKFCENCFYRNSEALLSVVENTFLRYHDLNLSPQKLRLKMCDLDSQSILVLEKWISIFINPDTRVTTFRLSVDSYNSDSWARLELPSAVFKAESLESLCLHNCKISSIENALLTNLRELRLSEVYVDDETLGKVMSGCPLLEYAELESCNGLKTVSIANENWYLKDFKFVVGCYVYPTLPRWRLDRNNYFPHLKSLYLYRVHLSAESFEIFSCNFPLLEEFTLNYCGGFEEIKLFSHSLKHLTIDLIYSIKVDIDAPNILCFKFSGDFFPTAISFAKASREWKSQILILDNSGFICDDSLPRLLKALSQSQISLNISESTFYKKKQPGYRIKQIDRGLNDPVKVEHLVIYSTQPFNLDSLLSLFYDMLQICRPRYVNALEFPWTGKVTQCLWETLIHERENTKYGWEQHLEEVSIEAYDFREEVWHHVQETCLPECGSNYRKIRFGLKWRHYSLN